MPLFGSCFHKKEKWMNYENGGKIYELWKNHETERD